MPDLDIMASEGMQLTRHYVLAPVWAPSRASLLLGMHQGHTTVRNNQFDKALPANHTLASVLKEAGYATGIIGKWSCKGWKAAVLHIHEATVIEADKLYTSGSTATAEIFLEQGYHPVKLIYARQQESIPSLKLTR